MGWLWSTQNASSPTMATPRDEPGWEPSNPPSIVAPNNNTLTSDQFTNTNSAPPLQDTTSLHPSPTTSTSSAPPSPPSPITPRTHHPTHLSCRSAFDTAFYCQSLGGQFASIYRYGTLRSCSSQWSDFWWCVRTNRGMMGDEERAERTVKKGWEREGEKYYGWGDGEGVGKLSSEDIWEARRWKVRGAFGGEWEGVGRGLGMEKGEGRDMGMGVGGGKDEDGSG